MVKQGDAQGSNYNGPGETPGAWAKAVEMEAEHRKPRPHQPRNVGLVRNYLHKGFSMSPPPRERLIQQEVESSTLKPLKQFALVLGRTEGPCPPHPALGALRTAAPPSPAERAGGLSTDSFALSP